MSVSDYPTPGSQGSLREANRQRIIAAVRQRGSLTQTELASITGLSPATVHNIVKELAQSRVLRISPAIRSGRRATQISLERALGLVGGIHVGSRHMSVVVADVELKILATERFPLPPAHRADAGLIQASTLLQELIAALDASPGELLAAGIAVPGPVDATYHALLSHGLSRGWEGINIKALLESELDVPVSVDQDANLGALAEMRLGAAVEHDSVLYLRASHEVRAGITVGGQIMRGRSGMAAMVGHLVIDPHGPACYCGQRGCLERYVDSSALLAQAQQHCQALTLDDVLQHAAAGEESCQQVLAQAGTYLGHGIAQVINVVDPAMVIVGGYLAQAGPILLDPLTAEVRDRCLPSVFGPVPVRTTSLTPDPEILGALSAGLDHARLTGVLSV